MFARFFQGVANQPVPVFDHEREDWSFYYFASAALLTSVMLHMCFGYLQKKKEAHEGREIKRGLY